MSLERLTKHSSLGHRPNLTDRSVSAIGTSAAQSARLRARLFDRIDDRGAFDGLEVPDLVVHLAVTFGQHRHLVGTRHVQTLFKNSG